jgi:hypothetical protein
LAPTARQQSAAVRAAEAVPHTPIEAFPFVTGSDNNVTITTNVGPTYSLLFASTFSSQSDPYCEEVADDPTQVECQHITSVYPFFIEPTVRLNIAPSVRDFPIRPVADISSKVVGSYLQYTFHYALFAKDADAVWIALDTNTASPYIESLVITNPACHFISHPSTDTYRDILCRFNKATSAEFVFAQSTIAQPTWLPGYQAHYLLGLIVQVSYNKTTQYNRIQPSTILAYHAQRTVGQSRRAVEADSISGAITARYNTLYQRYQDDTSTDITQFSNDIIVSAPQKKHLLFKRSNENDGLAIVYFGRALSPNEYVITLSDQAPATHLHTSPASTLFVFSNTLVISLDAYTGGLIPYVVFDIKPTNSASDIVAIAGQVIPGQTSTPVQLGFYQTILQGSLAFDPDIIVNEDNIGTALASAIAATLTSTGYDASINATSTFFPYHIRYYDANEKDDDDDVQTLLIIILPSVAGFLILVVLVIYAKRRYNSYTPIKAK